MNDENMEKSDALQFLNDNQPLPPDEEIDQEIIYQYDKVREYFTENPDKECIPLFLNSFGKGSGFGVYQIVEDIFSNFSKDEVVPHLIQALRNEQGDVQFWSAQIAANFPDPALIDPLYRLLQTEDPDLRWAAVMALEEIGGERVEQMLANAYDDEDDEELREMIGAILED